MQPSLTPSAPCQPTVGGSSERSYVTTVSASVSGSYWVERKVPGGAEPGAASWPPDSLFTISLLQNGASLPQIHLLFFGLKWDWGPGGYLSLGL